MSVHEVQKSPLVSIVIPTYNHVVYITKCLDGILMQKVNFLIEILIGEDASTDGTREICIEYKNKYHDKITLFLNDRKNVIYIKGRPTGKWNFNNLIKNSNGKYIAICEGDDYWTDPLKLQKQVDFLEAHPDFVMCFHNAQIIYDDKNKPPKIYLKDMKQDIFTIEDVCRKEFIPTASSVFRNVIRKFPDWFYKCRYGDWPLFLIIAEHGKIKYINEVMSVYFVHPRGVWSKLNSLEAHLQKKDLLLTLNKAFKNKYRKYFFEGLVPEYISLCKLYRFENIFMAYIYAIKLLLILRYNKTRITKTGILKGLFTGKW
jgi:glycosyltransferase involved in cell wall biosynthesis